MQKIHNLVAMLSRFFNVLIIPVCLFIMIGCSKPVNNTPNYPDDQGPLKYKIENVRDTIMEQQDEVREIIFINRISGSKEEDVRLSALGMPQGMEVSFDPQTARPPFYSILKIKNTRVPVANYALQIAGKTLKSDSVRVPVSINVQPYYNNAIIYDSVFTEKLNCGTSGSSTHEIYISPDLSVRNKILIKGFWSGVWSNIVYGILDPATKTINIPSQLVNDITFSGSGTYTDDKIVITYTVVATTFNETCITTISRIK